MSEQTPLFHELEEALRGIDAMGAAEAHGVISGVLSGPRPNMDALLKSVFLDIASGLDTSEVERMLGLLRAGTQKQLAERESDFFPLMPDEDATLGARVEALADFCRGYVLGLVAGGVKDLTTLPGDAREVVDDFMKIAEAEAEASDELEEQSFAELLEYVRVGVQLVYEELSATD